MGIRNDRNGKSLQQDSLDILGGKRTTYKCHAPAILLAPPAAIEYTLSLLAIVSITG